MLQKKYREIDPRYDSSEVAWGTEQDVGSNFFQWHLMQEGMVASEIVRILREQKVKTMLKFDELINKLVLKKMTDKFHKTNVVVKKTLVEDGRLIKSMALPFLTYRRKIPVQFRDWFEKASGELPLIEMMAEINGDEIANVLNKNMKAAYRVGGQQALYEFNIAIVFHLVNEHVIEWGRNYNMVLADKVTKAVAENIKYEILDGLQNFEGIPDIRERILTQFNSPITIKVPSLLDAEGNVRRRAYEYQLSPERWATMVARSEAIRWSANGKIDGYKQTGVVEKVRFMATGDHRTCQDCSLMDGTEFTLDDSIGVIPIHCQGRCTWAPIVREDFTNKDKELIDELAEQNIEALYS